ncbi:type II secretion system protein [Vibrio aphrogenes]|uniref:type II secretion system protein n=1 Tax=Vibrio aphrogenes TaxID=1891186 RepID=UPI000B353016|nr:type II secretion system protein [Vibrio aphrogenes]
MKKQGGFTLIELVVVIVILGILAVTAAPKFLNLQDDAKVSAVKGLAGAMKGAMGITYGKAAVAGEEAKETGYILVDGVSTAVKYGYPTKDTLKNVVDGLDSDWASPVSDADTYGYEGFTGCYVLYTEASLSGGVAVPATVKLLGDNANCN